MSVLTAAGTVLTGASLRPTTVTVSVATEVAP